MILYNILTPLSSPRPSRHQINRIKRLKSIFCYGNGFYEVTFSLLNRFLCGLHEVYSHIMVSPDLFIYLFIYVFIYLSTRVERLSRGLV